MSKFASQRFWPAILASGFLLAAPALEAQNQYDVLARVLQPYGALFYSKAITRAMRGFRANGSETISAGNRRGHETRSLDLGCRKPSLARDTVGWPLRESDVASVRGRAESPQERQSSR